jgi:hypothetical protein
LSAFASPTAAGVAHRVEAKFKFETCSRASTSQTKVQVKSHQLLIPLTAIVPRLQAFS